MKIAIIMEGGNIQNILVQRRLGESDLEDVVVVDYDANSLGIDDQAELDEIIDVPQGDGSTAEAFVYWPCLERDNGFIAALENAVEGREAEIEAREPEMVE